MEKDVKPYYTHIASERFDVSVSSNAGPDAIRMVSVEKGTPVAFHQVNEGWMRMRIGEKIFCIRAGEREKMSQFLTFVSIAPDGSSEENSVSPSPYRGRWNRLDEIVSRVLLKLQERQHAAMQIPSAAASLSHNCELNSQPSEDQHLPERE